MRKPSTKAKLLIYAFFYITLSSCTGQVESKSDIEKNDISVSNLFETGDFNDPLFFNYGQLCQHLREIFQDNQGNLWFGTNVYDLMRYNGDTLQYITEKEGFSGGRVTEIAEDGSGNLWFATSFGLNKFDGKSFSLFTEKNGLSNSEIWSMLIDSNGAFWIGHNEGISRFDGRNFKNFYIPKPAVLKPNTVYSANRIVDIAEDKHGNLWLGTDGYGVIRFDGKDFQNYTTKNGLCDNTISELMIDSKGNLWIGTYYGGVSKYDGETFTNYTKEGLVSGVEVSSFFEDQNGDIWFGVENHGVYKYDGASFTNYAKKNGLNGSVLSIYRDRENRFWFGGWGGLFRYDGKTFAVITKEGPWN